MMKISRTLRWLRPRSKRYQKIRMKMIVKPQTKIKIKKFQQIAIMKKKNKLKK
jgi:hypothetical protein